MNYLPQAMALLESTRTVYPEIDFYVLIIDGTSRDIPYFPSAIILLPEDLLIQSEWLSQMRSYYDAMELATSLKPFLLDTLLIEGVETVTYLDPDILLFGEMLEGTKHARDFGIALTPHRLTPANIMKPEFLELAFLKYGVFNLGYIAVGQQSKEMLKWWGSRLRWYCTKFPNDPSFTDQKWINFVPALFTYKTVSSKGYNLASWNLDERPLTVARGRIFAGADPLVFIHFAQMSGVLAAGRKTDHWEHTLDSSKQSINSLHLISEISNDYSQRLVDFALTVKPVDKVRMDDYRVSYHTKKALIRKHIGAASLTHDTQQRNLELFAHKRGQGLSLFLEKSSALNGFRDGFGVDLAKFRSLVRRLTKKP